MDYKITETEGHEYLKEKSTENKLMILPKIIKTKSLTRKITHLYTNTKRTVMNKIKTNAKQIIHT